jgi:hypothetical protein
MQDMSYLDRVVSGEGQNRLNKNLRVKGLGFDDLNCNIACCALYDTKTSKVKNIPLGVRI